MRGRWSNTTYPCRLTPTLPLQAVGKSASPHRPVSSQSNCKAKVLVVSLKEQALGSSKCPALNSKPLVRSPADSCHWKSVFFDKPLPTEKMMRCGIWRATEPAVRQHWSELSCWQVTQGSLLTTRGCPRFWEPGHRRLFWQWCRPRPERSAPICKTIGQVSERSTQNLWERGGEGGGRCHASMFPSVEIRIDACAGCLRHGSGGGTLQ